MPCSQVSGCYWIPRQPSTSGSPGTAPGETQQLLFVNHAGLKVLETGFTEFAGMVDKGKVTLLASGASFSRCLAACAGIKPAATSLGSAGRCREAGRPRNQCMAGQRRNASGWIWSAPSKAGQQERQQRKQAMLEQLQMGSREALRLRRSGRLPSNCGRNRHNMLDCSWA